MNFSDLGEIAIIIMGSITSVGILVGGAGYLLGKWKGSTKEERAESVEILSNNDQIKQFYKEQNDDLKVINKSLSEQIQQLTREVGELRGQLNAETKAKSEYLAILQNRDPETKKFMEFMMKAEQDHAQTHAEIIRILSEIHVMSKAEHDRDFKVEATVTKQ